MIAIAGRLTIPGSSPKGAATRACGRWTPKEAKRLSK
jgi:hypothetical protein